MSKTSKFYILTYHSIDESGSVISVAPAMFRRQMEHLYNAGFRTVTLRQAQLALSGGESIGERTIVLTFDDGFHNFYTDAFPILSEFGFRATVFLVTDRCGKENDWSDHGVAIPKAPLMSWNEIRELHSAGVEFGSHTETHCDLTTVTPEQVEAELVRSKGKISDHLGCETTSFAYPYGSFDRKIQRSVSANYQAACSTNLGSVSAGSDPSALRRIDAHYLKNRTALERLGSKSFDGYIGVRQVGRRIRSFL